MRASTPQISPPSAPPPGRGGGRGKPQRDGDTSPDPPSRSPPPALHTLARARHRATAALRFQRTKERSSAISAMAPSPSPKKVLVPVANGTEPMEAVITIDILRRAGVDVTVASVEKELRVEASWGIKIVADPFISDCAGSSFDLISLPGGMPGSATLRDCEILEEMVKMHAVNGGLYAAICAAPAVALGSWGLLKGLKAICYPSFMEKLPSDVTAVESRVQQDGRAITSRGAGTAMEFALALVEQLYGKDKAHEVAQPMVQKYLAT